MNKMSCIICALVCVWACDSQRYTPDEGSGPGIVPDPRKEEFLCCAVSYPNGYNWRRDSLGGAVSKHLHLYLNDSLVRSIPVDAEHGLSEDIDRHMIGGGHIISYGRRGSETILSVDGQTKGAFTSGEQITDMKLFHGSIYTLGVESRTQSWCVRKDGMQIKRGSRGGPVGGLFVDSGQMCFFYAVYGSGAQGGEYHFVHGTSDDVVLKASGGGEIICARRINGRMHMLQKEGDGAVTWYMQEIARRLDVKADDIACARFICTAGKCILYCMLKSGARWVEQFWRVGDEDIRLGEGQQVYSIVEDAPFLAYTHSVGGTNDFMMLTAGGQTTYFSEEMMISPYAVACNEDGWWIGMNEKNLRPVIIHGADTLKYDFNGYFTYISLP